MNIYKRDISLSAETSGTAIVKEHAGKVQLGPGWRWMREEGGEGEDRGFSFRGTGRGEVDFPLLWGTCSPRSTLSHPCCALRGSSSPFIHLPSYTGSFQRTGAVEAHLVPPTPGQYAGTELEPRKKDKEIVSVAQP